jgi:zinc transporter ZupT
MIYLLYAVIATVSSIFGGLLPLYTKIKDIKTQYLIGFASGVLISTAIFEMLPETSEMTSMQNLSLPIAMGFFSLYLVEKVAMIHACTEMECNIHNVSWVSLIGLGLESLLDGIAIAIGYFANPALGLIIAIAVISHEVPVGFSTSVVMRHSGYSVQKSVVALVVTSALTVVGALISPLFPPVYFGQILAFTAGTFIYIGASDLLPEAHQNVDWTVVSMVLAGAVLVPLIEVVFSI